MGLVAQPGDDRGQRRLAGAVLADEGDRLSRVDGQGNVDGRRRLSVWVGDADPVHDTGPAEFPRSRAASSVAEPRLERRDGAVPEAARQDTGPVGAVRDEAKRRVSQRV